MQISAEGKLGIGLGLMGLAGAGALVIAPADVAPEIGWAMIAAALAGFVMLGWHHFRVSAYVGTGISRLKALWSPQAHRQIADKEIATTMFVPRMDTVLAKLVTDEASLLKMARSLEKIELRIKAKLNTETVAYAQELVSILQSGTRDMPPPTPIEELELLRRTRELFVRLKGNDVLVYAETHFKLLPERWEEPKTRDPFEAEYQLILAFGPPLEHGEDRIEVEVDNGQPRTIPRKLVF
jgi:hypothetical protein